MKVIEGFNEFFRKMSADEDLEARIAMALIQLFSGLEEKNLALFLRKILDEVYTESGHNVSENFDETKNSLMRELRELKAILTDACKLLTQAREKKASELQ